MDTKSIEQGLRIAGKAISRNAHTILTVGAVLGVGTSVYLTAKAAPEASEAFEDAKKAYIEKNGSEEKGKAILAGLKASWKPYIWAGVSAIGTVTCIIGLNGVHKHREVAIAGLYTVTQSAFEEYRAQVREKLGEKKAREVDDEIQQKHINANPPSSQILVTGPGDSLMYDSLSGRYFQGNIERIRQVVNEYNRDLLTEMYKTLNEWYMEIGLEPVDMGTVGWHVETGLLDVMFSTKLYKDQGCIVLSYSNGPRPL